MNRRGVPEVLERTQALMAPTLAEVLDRLAADLDRPIRYHFGLVDPSGVPLPSSGGGKGIRPALALLSAEAAGEAAEVALPGAVAVELVHNFSLLHDDIIDDDPVRRHRPTVWKVFGEDRAIIAGDAAMVLALEVMLDDPTAPRVAAAADLVRATMSMIAGQYMEMQFDHMEKVDLDMCWEMVSLKTGALLAHASAVGAILADAPDRTIRNLRHFGAQLGRGFQAVDDLLSIWGDPTSTGKPEASDLRERKKSIPVTVALTSGTAAGRKLADLYARDHLEEAEIETAAALVEEAGGRKVTTAAARRCMTLAAASLKDAGIDPQISAELVELTEFVAERAF